MTEIRYKPDEFSLMISGHAGYAEAGVDIVCAGISALMFALPASLRTRGIKYFLDLSQPDGRASITAYPTPEQRYISAVVFETIAGGLELLAENYPDNAKYTKEAE